MSPHLLLADSMKTRFKWRKKFFSQEEEGKIRKFREGRVEAGKTPGLRHFGCEGLMLIMDQNAKFRDGLMGHFEKLRSL